MQKKKKSIAVDKMPSLKMLKYDILMLDFLSQLRLGSIVFIFNHE